MKHSAEILKELNDAYRMRLGCPPRPTETLAMLCTAAIVAALSELTEQARRLADSVEP